MSDSRASFDRAVALALSTLVGLGLWALLQRGLFEAQAQSHDAPLYVRSLWGIAHGDFDNSLIDYPSLAIHSQFALLVLAPFARIWHAAHVLIAAQALTFAATLFVWLTALLRAAALSKRGTVVLAAWASLLFCYGMPLVANPFVFDVRPEMLGVFFATAGLLRSAQLQRFDRFSVVLLLIAAAAREEFALIAACALTLSPVPRPRVILPGILILYVLANSYLWPRSDSQAAHLTSAAAWPDLMLSKLQLTAAFAATGGGLAALGYRWLGSALPGVAVLALSTWMAREQISFHYGMFVAPALLTASYAGFVRVLELRPARVWLGAHVLVTLACAALLSALPGGMRFAREHFDLANPLRWGAHSPWLSEVHRVLQTVPRDQSLLLQYMLATPYADRASIRVLEVENPKPWQPDAVFLPQKLWASRGVQLREQGYKLASLAGSSYALMSRRSSTPLHEVLSADGCESVSISWPDAGIQLCNAWLEPSGHVSVLLGRSDNTASRGTQLELSAAEQVITLAPLAGLISLDELPKGRVAWSTSPRALPNAKVTFTLRQANGQPVPLAVQGEQKERITLALLPPQ